LTFSRPVVSAGATAARPASKNKQDLFKFQEVIFTIKNLSGNTVETLDTIMTKKG
jgi:hypothetical protein